MSARGLPVYMVAPAVTAEWLRRILEPVFQIVRAEFRPVELRPTGQFGGWSDGDRKTNPDGRICMSKCAQLWSKRSVVCVALHELSHALLAEAARAAKLSKERLVLQKQERQSKLELWRGLAALFCAGFPSTIWIAIWR